MWAKNTLCPIESTRTHLWSEEITKRKIPSSPFRLGHAHVGELYFSLEQLISIWCNPTLRSPTVEPTGRTHTIQGLWITILSVFSFRSSCAYIYLGMTRTVPESCQWGEDEGLLYKLELAVQVRTIDLSLPPRTHRAFPRLRA